MIRAQSFDEHWSVNFTMQSVCFTCFFYSADYNLSLFRLYGSYEALKGGVMADSLTDLTGGVSESYKLRGEDANYPRNIISIMFKALDRHALIGCGIDVSISFLSPTESDKWSSLTVLCVDVWHCLWSVDRLEWL